MKSNMKFNTDKCKVLHLGIKNIKNNNSLMDTPINSVSSSKYLGIIILNDLKPYLQCNSAAMKTNRSLGMIASEKCKSARMKDFKTGLSLHTDATAINISKSILNQCLLHQLPL